MLLETALDHIALFVVKTPRTRIGGFLDRIKRGEALEVALILESISNRELAAIEHICEYQGLRENAVLLGELIDSAYRNRSTLPRELQLAWTGPKLDPALRSTRTGIAARSIADSANQRILIAGYHVTSEILDEIGIWAAKARGITVTVMVDGKTLHASDAHIFRAKGLQLYEIRGANKDYAKFHVKTIIADGKFGLLGSANFTSLGHGSNVELGLIFDGQIALAIENVLRDYLRVAESTGWIISS